MDYQNALNSMGITNADLNGADPASIFSFIAGLGISFIIISLIIGILTIVATWILYDKAHEHGWAAIVPVYHDYVFFKVSWGNGWYFVILYALSIVASLVGSKSTIASVISTILYIALIVYSIITLYKFSKAYGQGAGFTVGLIFLNTIFLCIMAFSRGIQYVGLTGAAPAAAAAPVSPYTPAAPAAPEAPAAPDDQQKSDQ